MRFLKVLIPLMAISFQVSAEELGEPAYIADQKRITSDGMKHENDQFRARANFKNAQSQLSSNIIRRDLLKTEFERAKSLAEKGQMTDSQLQMAQQNYQGSLDTVAKTTAELQKSKSTALVEKLRILEIGNPDTDHRFEIAAAMMDSMESEKVGLEQNLVSAQQMRGYFQHRVENGKYLYDRNVISLQEYEKRQLDLRNAEDSLHAIEFQIDGIKESLLGLSATRKKL